MVLVALLLLGGTTIHNMVLALLIGVVCGAYTSICIASPLWYEMKKLETRPKTKAARV
jgi:preprotein translocase subunit SecF